MPRPLLSRLLRRWLLRPLLIVGVPLLAIAAGVLYWLSTSLPETTGTISLDGIKAPVEIVRDRDGVPHIFARSEEDAAFALGFVHAQDRLWQMEQTRRFAAGRLSELVGAAALPLDRLSRTLGLERLAESSLAALDPPLRAKLDAYTAGVNAYLTHHRGAWPPEFVLLNASPERWRPVDCLLWGELMAVQLSGHWHRELLRARLLKRLTPAELEQLWPPYPGDAPTTLADDATLLRGLPLERLAAASAAFDGQGASNAWVVDGAHSATGKPILANDPHLGFSLPGLWYLARIDTPTLRIAGATVPGVPLVVLGHNDRIAWGMTTTGGNVEDLFVEKLDPEDANRYLSPEGSLPFRTRTETINVRGGPSVSLTVRETRHGPVISDAVEEAGAAAGRGMVLALAATWLRPGNRIASALYGIDKARDWQSFVAALRDFDAPEQNVTYADRDGHIGFYAAGAVPLRKKGDGTLPVPGWSGDYDWAGDIPFGALPHGLDPPGGHFANANNKVTPPGYPYAITEDGWDAPYRVARISERLAAMPHATLGEFAKLQADSVSLAARDLLPLLAASAPADDAAKAVIERMRAWDGTMARGRAEPLIFAAWLRELNRVLFAAKLGTEFPEFWGQRADLIRSVFAAHPEWCARGAPRPADCAARSAEALSRALAWLGQRFGGSPASWRWGAAHEATFRNRVLERVPLIGPLLNGRIPADGGAYTINRGGFQVANEASPFADIHGAGYRALYDLAALDRSRFMIATGQSGNPFSSHFKDLLRRWRDFDYLALAGGRDEILKGGGSLLTLAPR